MRQGGYTPWSAFNRYTPRYLVSFRPAPTLERHPDLVNRCLGAYVRGDWGLSSEPEQNDEAVRSGDGRLFAAYPIDPARPSAGYGANTLWIITEADHSVTTLLRPRSIERKLRG